MNYLSDITINNSNMGHTNKFSLIHRDNDDLKTGLSKETFFKNNKNIVIYFISNGKNSK